MTLASQIKKKFWIFLVAPLVLGLAVPQFGIHLTFLLQPFIILILLFVFLKLNLKDILFHLRNLPKMILFAIIMLFAVPILIFWITNLFDQTLAFGFLLLAIVPPAVSSPVFTDLLDGNESLSMSIVIFCSLLAPFSITFIFMLLGSTSALQIDTITMFKTLAIMIFVPMILSEIIKCLFPKQIKKAVPYFNPINVLIVFFFVYISFAVQQEVILNNLKTSFLQIIYLYIFFLLLHGIGYFLAWKRNRIDTVTIIISNVYRNNGIAIVLALTLFPPEILTIAILSQIPWVTMLLPFKWLLKYMR